MLGVQAKDEHNPVLTRAVVVSHGERIAVGIAGGRPEPQSLMEGQGSRIHRGCYTLDHLCAPLPAVVEKARIKGSCNIGAPESWIDARKMHIAGIFVHIGDKPHKETNDAIAVQADETGILEMNEEQPGQHVRHIPAAPPGVYSLDHIGVIGFLDIPNSQFKFIHVRLTLRPDPHSWGLGIDAEGAGHCFIASGNRGTDASRIEKHKGVTFAKITRQNSRPRAWHCTPVYAFLAMTANSFDFRS